MGKAYNWVVIGCGWIANELGEAFVSNGRKIYGVANRTYENAKAYAEKYGVEKVYSSIEEVFSDDAADIVYIATPHNTHITYLRKALLAGKHVLCEKAITLNTEELNEAAYLAHKSGVILAEAMTLYHMPIYKRLNEIIGSGKLGKLKVMQINFGSYKPYDMENRFFNKKLAGGAILDIGVYALSCARWFMSSAPDKISAQVRLAPSGADEQVSILLENKDEEMAALMISLHAKQPKRSMISFEKGYVEIYDYPRAEEAVITFTESGEKEVICAGETKNALAYEADDMEAAIEGAKDIMHLNYTSDVMRIMTKIRYENDVIYPEEEEYYRECNLSCDTCI